MKLAKLFNGLLLSLALIALNSCLDQPQGQYSPSIICDNIVTNNGDTLKLRLDSNQEYYWLDTMTIGDTAKFGFTFYGYANNLISTEIKIDTIYAAINMPLSEDIRQAILETSDTLNGQINYKPGYNAALIFADYIALKEGTPSIKLSVHSDSKFSPTTFEIRTPIRQ